MPRTVEVTNTYTIFRLEPRTQERFIVEGQARGPNAERALLRWSRERNVNPEKFVAALNPGM